MNQMNDIFYSEMRKLYSFQKVGARLIARKLEKRGLTVSKEQIERIEAALDRVQDGVENAIITLDEIFPEIEEDIALDLEEGDDLDSVLDEVADKSTSITTTIARDMGKYILKSLIEDAPRMLNEHSEIRARFEKSVHKKWGKALEYLEILLVISYEAGEGFNEEFRSTAAEMDNYVFDVLVRLHARACQIASEVLTLLKAGYADGAHARWRTIHEIAVVASFIEGNGNDVAERYLLHQYIESYKAALQHQRYATRLKHSPIPEGEVIALKELYEELLGRFGKDYRNSYGWAGNALSKSDPNFFDIEEAVNLDHLRPYYKMASYNVHANSKGIMFRLGLSNENMLLAGASNIGLADPGHGIAISLSQITLTMLFSEVNIDRLVLGQTMMQLTDKIGSLFIKAHRNNNSRTGRIRRGTPHFRSNKSLR